jgi:hypothetical protein
MCTMVYIAHGKSLWILCPKFVEWMKSFAFGFKLHDGRPVSFRQPASWEEEEEVQSAAAATQVGFRV